MSCYQNFASDKLFTGHEHVDAVGLIHMNGRAYDPELGRFLSVDPFIQAPTNSQSLNPYSYVMNNPLSGTDPTGYACEPATGSHICSGGGSVNLGKIDAKDIKNVEVAKNGRITINTNDGKSFRVDKISNGKETAKFDAKNGGWDKSPSKLMSNSMRNGGSARNSTTGAADPEPANITDDVTVNRGLINNGGVTYKNTRGRRETLSVTGLVYDHGTGQGQAFVDAVNEGWTTSEMNNGVTVQVMRTSVALTDDPSKASFTLQNCGAGQCPLKVGKNGGLVQTEGRARIGGSVIFLTAAADKKTYVHEFGHSLGLGHQENKFNSIMSYSRNAKVLGSDVSKLVKAYVADPYVNN